MRIKNQLIAFLLNENTLAYFIAIITVFICTLCGFFLRTFIDASNLIMIYLLGVVVVATMNGERFGPSVLSALLSTLTFDFFFIPPYLSFAISDVQYFFTFIIMLLITQIISHLAIRVQRHTELTHKAKLQTEQERMRNVLLSSISHDLRTPLTAIMGSASSLLETNTNLDSITVHELLKNIYDESERLNRLVNNVLQMIRLESATIKISKHKQSLEEIIGAALSALAEQIKNKSIKIVTTLPEKLPLIPLDHILIEQVLINLIENAVKYAPLHSSIEISAQLIRANFHEEDLKIKVADEGPGLNKDSLQNIFDPFYRSNVKKRGDAGFGLGLAICKNIIKAHGGSIWAQNRKKGGALFCFTLPIV